MKIKTWKKHHKWFGLLFCIFIILFCLSGVILNHRSLVSSIEISRKWMPSLFQYKKWNNSLLKGSIPFEHSIFIYGTAGVFKTDSLASSFQDFNKGFPKGVDNRNIQSLTTTPSHDLWAISQSSLYRYDNLQGWKRHFSNINERLADLTCKGDSLIILGRSHLYIAKPPYSDFQTLQLNAPSNFEGKVTLFRTIWLIHSGELFGLVGKIIVDTLAVILILLSITGILYWLLPNYIKTLKRRGKRPKTSSNILKKSFIWHDKIGRYSIILTLFLSFTGWCLRPPILLALVSSQVSPIPGSSLDSTNPWNDKLRALRFDIDHQDWILSSSEGFYRLDHLQSIPEYLIQAPPVSVMGINVFTKHNSKEWLIGSFSGLFTWNRSSGTIKDYFTGDTPTTSKGAPFGKRAIAGYTKDLRNKHCIIEYDNGLDLIPMPKEFEHLPISLWNLALEVHTGRIYTILGQGTLFYISFSGLIVIWILISGYIIRKRKRKE